MLIGINSAETRIYISKLDTDRENPTKFHLGTLDPFVRSHIEEQTNRLSMSSVNPDDQASLSYSPLKRNILIVRLGLKDIEGLIDPRVNQPIKFDTVSLPVGRKNYNVVSDSIISMMPVDLINELAEQILSDNRLNPAEAKN